MAAGFASLGGQAAPQSLESFEPAFHPLLSQQPWNAGQQSRLLDSSESAVEVVQVSLPVRKAGSADGSAPPDKSVLSVAPRNVREGNGDNDCITLFLSVITQKSG
jgi:hypothetical protein